ncbi:hypothetical protein OQA88_10553 [Cercophora sp. LCS_1]
MPSGLPEGQVLVGTVNKTGLHPGGVQPQHEHTELEEELHEKAHIDYDRVAIIPNPSVAVLYEDALVYETGTAITSSGALTAYSGKKTGRSPLDKRIVKEKTSEKDFCILHFARSSWRTAEFLGRDSTTPIRRDALRRILEIDPEQEPTKRLLPVDEADIKLKLLRTLKCYWEVHFPELTGQPRDHYKPLHQVSLLKIGKVEYQYAERMLSAFRIQWAAIKILLLAGGAEPLDDVGDSPDYLDENLNWMGDVKRGMAASDLFKTWEG